MYSYCRQSTYCWFSFATFLVSHDCEIGQFIGFPVNYEGHFHQAPHVIIRTLARRKPEVLQTVFVNDSPHCLPVHENGLKHGEQLFRREILLCHTFLVELQEKLAVIIFPVRKFGVDRHLFDTAVGKQELLHLVRPMIQFVVIVAIHLYPETAGRLADVVAESLILQPVHAPASAAQRQCLAYDIRFQYVWETAVLVLLLEKDLDGSMTGIVYGCLELSDLLKLTQKSLHPFYQRVHLLQRASVGQRGVYRQHHFTLVAPEIAAVIYFLYEQAQGSAQCLVDYRLHVLAVSGIVEHLVIQFRPSAFRFRLLNLFGKHEHRNLIDYDKSPIGLSVFSVNGWQVIGEGVRKNRTMAHFNNIEPAIIYMPVKLGSEIQPAGYPFMLTPNGQVEEFVPDTANCEEVVLSRKMALIPRVAAWGYSQIGARIEGDNNIKFSNPKLMAEIKDTIDYTFQVWESNYTNPIRYIRYVPPTGILQVAEIKLYEDTSLEKEIRMKPVTLLPYIEHVTDGDILSFLYLTSEGIIEPLVFALERPQSIRSIYYVTRTDDNYVWEGDVYELLYQDGPDGWKSLGTKAATSKHITFNAPKNALLWLRDKTKGREEQVFIYKHNRQWFNSDFK